jgi:hypothetical protein
MLSSPIATRLTPRGPQVLLPPQPLSERQFQLPPPLLQVSEMLQQEKMPQPPL